MKDAARERAALARYRRPILIELDGVPMMSAQELDAAAAADLEAVKAEADDEYAAAAELAAGDNEDVNDFDESDVADAADEAIGELERAESVIRAIAIEHRPVEAWTRRRGVGLMNVQYRTHCCLSCRDPEGQPVPAPCRTAQLLDGYGEA